ncbi:MAG: NAD kinase [Saprospiraceae bacterium]|nr:NAD kinase [Saprospiraceae bacterium]
MQVVVFGKKFKKEHVPYIQALFDKLAKEGISAYVNTRYLEQIKPEVNFQSNVGEFKGYLDFKVRKYNFVITVGGDGTILEAVTEVRDSGVPILGINLGRLGFLASIEKSYVDEAIDLVMKGMYTVNERTLLHIDSNFPLFGDLNFALNDCTLLKRDSSSMIVIHAFLNGAYLSSYWCDGIIISTPTGSTGYSLSCGGPIIFPNSGNFVITPVAPHNLNVRPIVISDTSVLSFEVEGRSDSFLCTMDSRFENITSNHQLAVRKADFTIKLVQLQSRNFLNTLQNKLAWGMDKRN